MPKVSVIIPVYNTEKYLRKCLDSVCSQTLSDIEIICINDCSTDNSLEILNEYPKKDKRIKIIDFKENKGASVARNKGIDEAKGEYIGFVDSDDYPDIDFYEELYNRAKETSSDCAKGNYRYAKTNLVPEYLNEKIKEDKNNFSFAYCSAIFKKSVLDENNIKFPEICDMEDPVFTYKFALKANKVEIVETYINITTREDSQTMQPVSMQRVKSRIYGLNTIFDLANNSNIPKESYSFTTAYWTWSVFANSVKIPNKNTGPYLVNSILDLTKKVKYPDLYYNELNKLNAFFKDRLMNKDIEQLINFNKYHFLFLIKNKIKAENNKNKLNNGDSNG